MRKILFFLGELKFQLSQAPLLVGYAIMAMIVYPVSFSVIMFGRGMSAVEIHDAWKAVTPSILRIEAACFFIVTLWVIWSVVKTITFFKKQKEDE